MVSTRDNPVSDRKDNNGDGFSWDPLSDLLLGQIIHKLGSRDYSQISELLARHPLCAKYRTKAITADECSERHRELLVAHGLQAEDGATEDDKTRSSDTHLKLCEELYSDYRAQLIQQIRSHEERFKVVAHELEELRSSGAEVSPTTPKVSGTKRKAENEPVSVPDVVAGSPGEPVSQPKKAIRGRSNESPKVPENIADDKSNVLPEAREPEVETPGRDEEVGPATTPNITTSANKRFTSLVLPVLQNISQHRYGNVFAQPIQERDAPDYKELVRQPQDFRTIRSQVKSGEISTTAQFYREVLRVFMNAIMYNNEGSTVSEWASECFEHAEEAMSMFQELEWLQATPKDEYAGPDPNTPKYKRKKVTPRNARSKRALKKREPQTVENAKRALFLKGTTSSQVIGQVLTDLHALKKPEAIKFSKPNDIHPFDDASSIEFFSQKNDTSIVLVGSHQKKRPHNLTWVRTFNGEILDMLEMGVENFRSLSSFKEEKVSVGMRPLMVFQGNLFDDHPTYRHLKSLLLDFFSPGFANQIDQSGLQHVFVVSVDDQPASLLSAPSATPAKVHFRGYKVVMKKSNQLLPRIELSEMGPHMDLVLRRRHEPRDDMWKAAHRKPKVLEPKARKNVNTDLLGDKVGKIHVGAQNLGQLQSRKFKGLKRGPELDDQSDLKKIRPGEDDDDLEELDDEDETLGADDDLDADEQITTDSE